MKLLKDMCRVIGVLCCVSSYACIVAPPAAAETKLRVKAFGQVYAIAIFAAQSEGFFEKRGLTIDLSFTGSSQELREGLARGEFEIAHAGVDNDVAMVENAGADVVIVMGGDNGLNSLMVQPYIQKIEDLRGHILGADAVDTAYALQFKKILGMHGIGPDAYQMKALGATPKRLQALLDNKEIAGAALTLPYSILAERAGLRNLGFTVDFTGRYQATGAFVQREWARQNSALLEKYLAAYIEGLRWALAPDHKEAAAELLAHYLKIDLDIAQQSLKIATDPVSGGLARDAAFDVEGFHNVLAIRAETAGKVSDKPEKYYDLSYYDRAWRSLNP